MSEKEPPQENASTDGVDEFKSAVNLVVTQRDQGDVIVYFSPYRGVRVIGELPAETSTATRERVREVERLLGVQIRTDSAESAVIAWWRGPFSPPESDEEDKRKEQRAATLKKFEYLERQQLVNSLKSRFDRVKSATGAALEELESELVTKRYATVSDSVLNSPYLRLRIRHSLAEEAMPATELLGGVMNPFGTVSMKSFEIECDEHDIDLMLMRLQAAKRALIDLRGQQDG